MEDLWNHDNGNGTVDGSRSIEWWHKLEGPGSPLLLLFLSSWHNSLLFCWLNKLQHTLVALDMWYLCRWKWIGQLSTMLGRFQNYNCTGTACPEAQLSLEHNVLGITADLVSFELSKTLAFSWCHMEWKWLKTVFVMITILSDEDQSEPFHLPFWLKVVPILWWWWCSPATIGLIVYHTHDCSGKNTWF